MVDANVCQGIYKLLQLVLKLATKTAHANTFCSCCFRMLLSFLDSGQARLGSYIAQIHTTVGSRQPRSEAATAFADWNALATIWQTWLLRTHYPLTCATRTSYGMQAYMAQFMFESIYFQLHIKHIIIRKQKQHRFFFFWNGDNVHCLHHL